MNTGEKISRLVKKLGDTIPILERKRKFWIFSRTIHLGRLFIKDNEDNQKANGGV